MLTRRRLLQLPALALLAPIAGCRSSPPSSPRPAADPDQPARERLRAAERRLLAAYDATMVRHPSLAAQLRPIRAHHLAHLAAVPGQAVPSTASLGTGAGPAPALVPGDAAGAVRSLVTAERAAARACAADCGSAGASLAEVLASIGASEAAHAAVLPTLARGALR